MKRILITLIIAGAALITTIETKAQAYYTTYTYSYGEWSIPTYISSVVYDNYYDYRIVNARSYYVNGFLTYNLFLDLGNSFVEVVVDRHGHIVNRYFYASIPVNHVWIHTYYSPFFKPYHHHGHHTVYYYNNFHHHNHAYHHDHYSHHNKVSYSSNHYVVKKNDHKVVDTRNNDSRYNNNYPSRPESERIKVNERTNSTQRNYSNSSSYERSKSNSTSVTPHERPVNSRGSSNNNYVKKTNSNNSSRIANSSSNRSINQRASNSSNQVAQNSRGSR